LLPNILRDLSGAVGAGGRLNRKSVFTTLAFLVVFALFLIFFFWSRAPVVAGG
jgi:hypothetical protein